MLRLITTLAALPLLLQIFPDWLFRVTTEMMPPEDLSVPAEEHALRDLIPGWEPVRTLTEREMVPIWAPFQMRLGGSFPVGGYKAAPTIPSAWISDWPEPPPLEPTAVPRGWWWKPKAPEHLGIWLVLGKGRGYGVFYSMVTTPLHAVDLTRISRMDAMHALYTALRDREAKKRGVDPATLDREARLIESGATPPSEVDEAIRRVKELMQQDRFEDALALLTPLIDEDAGTEVDRARALMIAGALQASMGQPEEALALFQLARPLAADQGLVKMVHIMDERIRLIEALPPVTSAARLAARGITSLEHGNPAGARAWFERSLAAIGVEDEIDTAFVVRARLAHVCERLGDPAAARAHATAALALAPRVDDPEKVAELRALLARLDAAAPAPPR